MDPDPDWIRFQQQAGSRFGEYGFETMVSSQGYVAPCRFSLLHCDVVLLNDFYYIYYIVMYVVLY